MKKLTLLFSTLLVCTHIFAHPFFKHKIIAPPAEAPRIQVAILLDVSGSMDGLIEQAKAQLWSMVQTLGKAKCNNTSPKTEIALYEYGRPSNGGNNNYIKQIKPFTNDLDELSAELFKLKTDGGDEYCGAVLVKAIKDLTWDANPNLYKVIFIAGNESFKQGNTPFTEACKLAKEKGIIINTIYCGDYKTGISEYWNLNGECGSGSYSNINQNEKQEDIRTPQDSIIYALNSQLNGSYITYNGSGKTKLALQESMDEANKTAGYSIAAKRAAVKADKNVYNNAGWDLVDAYNADSTIVSRVEPAFLPKEIKGKSTTEIKQYIALKIKERGAIQKQIFTQMALREKYLVQAKKQNGNLAAQTLENTIQTLIKTQASKFNILFEK